MTSRYANTVVSFLSVLITNGRTADAVGARLNQENLVGKIVQFRLIDSDTDLPLLNFTNGQTLNIPIPGPSNFNIDAMTADGPVGSVQFSYLGDDDYRLESRPPFAVCGDDWRTQDYKICPPFVVGTYTVVATPFSEIFAGGTKGASVTLQFTVSDSPPTNAPKKAPTTVPLKPPTNPPTKAPVKVTTNAPRSPPTVAPRKPPTKTPTKAPIKVTTNAPRKPPTIAPRKPPTKNPTKAPMRAATDAPRKPPTNAPRMPPTNVPTKPPTTSPTKSPSAAVCTIPKFVDEDWEIAGPQYPLRNGEPQGLLVGNDLVIFSGFINSYANATNQTYARDVTDSNSAWRQMDDMPMSSGVTHAATLVVGSKVYLCGGYMGGHPGPHVPYCFVYDHSVQPGQQQWTKFTDLPEGGSAGGGMVYDTNSNSLFYAGGGQRRTAGSAHPVDINSAWKFQLSRPSSGWVATAPIPYLANHLSYVTHRDGQGRERHYFLGGQVGEYECCTNFGLNYEFVVRTETWIKRASIPLARGHASASTRAIGCGFIIAGGAIDSGSTRKVRTNDISYYDVPSNTWTTGIGTLPKESATPILDIHIDGYMYYVTGLPNQSRRRISV